MTAHMHVCGILAGAALAVAGCGLVTFPFSFGDAVSRNATFMFKGKVVDASGQALEGVVARLENSHHVWTPLEGSADQGGVLTRRVDGTYEFEFRGSSSEFTFSKDGYRDAYYRLSADKPDEVYTQAGVWRRGDNFPVVLLSSRVPLAPLVPFDAVISYADYPVADALALPNLATHAANGDVVYAEKNAEDPTVFPPGTLYVTLDKAPPTALNAKGDIDVADLNIPSHVTLHLPGAGSGFVAIEPRVGFHPLDTTDAAPAAGYAHELTFTRARLKEMRTANPESIIEAHAYFVFRADRYFGKGVFSWSNQSGKPAFHYELYINPEPDNRDLHYYPVRK